jgi:hypothetical protein
MSKLKPIYVIIPGAILPVIVVCVFLFVLLPPVNKEITSTSQQRDQRKAKAETRKQVEEDKRLAEENLKKQTEKLEGYMRTRSIALSTYQPIQAMIALWFEFQEDLKPVIEDFITQSGCQIIQGAPLPSPEMKKPTLGPGNFLSLPTLNLRVRGTMPQLRKLYASLKGFKRVATIGSLELAPPPAGGGEELEATVPFTVYILAEGPEQAAQPAAPAAAGPAPGAGAPTAAGAGAAATPPSKGGGEGEGGGGGGEGGGGGLKGLSSRGAGGDLE